MEGGDDNIMGDDFDIIFRQKDVGKIRNFLKTHNVDVNVCSIPLTDLKRIHLSVIRYALVHFDRAVMSCLLEEFGADLNAPCTVCTVPRFVRLDYPVFEACFGVGDRLEVLEYVIDHGATPFAVARGATNFLTRPVSGQALHLLECAKKRIRTAWVVVWTFSQLTGTMWPDMSEPLVKMLMAMPAMEFSRDTYKRHKKK
jgi:hypothetical protein